LLLQEVENRLMNYTPNPDISIDEHLQREEFEVETINLESAKVFRQYGGIEVKRCSNFSHLF
jgi:hypothetical protein